MLIILVTIRIIICNNIPHLRSLLCFRMSSVDVPSQMPDCILMWVSDVTEILPDAVEKGRENSNNNSRF